MKLAPLPDLACQDVVELVSDYVDRALSTEDLARIEQHFLICPPCSAYLGQMKRSIALSAGLRTTDVEREAIDPALLEAFRSRRSK